MEEKILTLPDKVLIGHREYDVSLVENGTLKDDYGNVLHGQINYVDKTITLESGMPHFLVREIFIHEILHGISYNAGHVLTEEQVVMLSVGLQGLFQDNQDVLKVYLNEE